MKFKPGDIIENGHASEDNPIRIGVVVEVWSHCYDMTNLKGDVWECPIDNEKLKKIGELGLPKGSLTTKK